MDERISTAFRYAGRAFRPGPPPADMSPDALAFARGNGLLAPAEPADRRKTAAMPAAPRKAVKKTSAGSR